MEAIDETQILGGREIGEYAEIRVSSRRMGKSDRRLDGLTKPPVERSGMKSTAVRGERGTANSPGYW